MSFLGGEQVVEECQVTYELQQQKAMMWVLGEIMKRASDINCFKTVMKLTTDMLMGVTGVNTCYLWIYDKRSEIKVYLRTTQKNNIFQELGESTMHKYLEGITETKYFTYDEIDFPLLADIALPASRLVVPLIDFSRSSIMGGLVLEQQQKDFFTATNVVFFETLSTFIACTAKNSKMFEVVADESERDPLTGVYNRRNLEKMMREMNKKKGQLSLAIIDIDNFKPVNDMLGHTKGDVVLKDIAAFADTFFSSAKGKVVRYGGDEFIFLLPLALDDAVKLFSDFQSMVPKLAVIRELHVPVSITMGVSSYPELIPDIHRLIQKADQILLKAKEQGKNKVFIAEKEC